jgi:phosphotransferase system HPr (HPr) family protein
MKGEAKMKSDSVKVKSIYETNAAALLVQTASQFKSLISLRLDNKTANAKSVRGLLSLGMVGGQEVFVQAEGEDEDLAVREVGEFLGSYSV